PHSVSIVDIEKGSLPSLSRIVIKPLRELKTFPEKPVDFKKALKLFAKLPDNDNSYIRLNVVQENDLPADCLELASSIAADKDCRFCIIKYTRLNSLQNEKEMINISSSQFAELNPNEIASRFFKASGIPDSQREIYMSLIEQLQNEYSLENNL
ncbi:MAG: exonuclease SbcCD subunit D C-terminal domain-containing protein, partial [Muribaculaceae bacterium]|nr:exonuclease SbcCD subunit D C-terminal domain-containing protein [Muribaculaceae bacterium]